MGFKSNWAWTLGLVVCKNKKHTQIENVQNKTLNEKYLMRDQNKMTFKIRTIFKYDTQLITTNNYDTT